MSKHNSAPSEKGVRRFQSMIIHDVEEKEQSKHKLCCSYRVLVGILIGICSFIMYAQRQTLNVTIICMVNKESIKDENQFNSSVNEYNCKNNHLFGNSIEQKIPYGKHNWDKQTRGVIIGAFYWGYCFQVFAGFIGARIGTKIALGLATLVSSVCTLLLPFAAEWSVIAVVGLRVLTGLAQSFIYPCALPLITNWSVSGERSIMASFISAGCSAGIIFSTLISGPVCATDYWGFNFLISGVMGLIWFIPWMKIADNCPNESLSISSNEKLYLKEKIAKEGQTFDVHSISPVNWPCKQILFSRSVWIIIATNVLSDFTLYGILSVFPTYLTEIFNVGVINNSYINGVSYSLMGILTIITGLVSSMFINKNILSKLNVRRIFNSIGMIAPAVLFGLIGFLDCSDYIIIILLFVLANALPGTYLSSGYLLNIVDISGPYSGIVIGISNSLASVSGILASYIAHMITHQDTYYQWRICFLMFSCVLALAGFIFLFFSKGELEKWAVVNSSNTNNLYVVCPSDQELKRVSMESDSVFLSNDSINKMNEENFKNTVLVYKPNNDEARTSSFCKAQNV